MLLVLVYLADTAPSNDEAAGFALVFALILIALFIAWMFNPHDN